MAITIPLPIDDLVQAQPDFRVADENHGTLVNRLTLSRHDDDIERTCGDR